MSQSKKAASVVEKGLNAAYMVQQGCTALIINLFICGFLGWGIYDAIIAIRLENNGQATPGTVIALDEHSDGGITYAPVVEYEAYGRTYSFTSGSYSYPAEYEVGEAATVRYDRDEPNTARIESSWLDRWLLPLILVPIMFIAFILANIWIIRRWRRGEDIDVS